MTSREVFIEAKKQLGGAGTPEAEAKAKVIISHALDTGLSEVYSETDVPDGVYRQIRSMARRCAAGEPVEYVTGRAYFRYLTLEVDPSVLIPRKETELVAGKAIELIKENSYRTVLDMCTGSGCIAISAAAETGINVDAADNSERALKKAKKNAELNGVSKLVRFLNSDMFNNIKGSYDIIVCNPPYVSEEEYGFLEDAVRLYEPGQALLAGDGLDFYRVIAKEGLKHLNPGGAVVLEIGATQEEKVRGLLNKGGFSGIECLKDYAGRDRIVCARKI
jgi:release factor glutamine methyltransferase